MLQLSASEVGGLLTMRDAIACTEKVFADQARGGVSAHSPFIVGFGDRELRVNAGALKGVGRAGLRAGMRGASVALIFDIETRQLLSVMAYPFSYLRVGATVGVAVGQLAPRDAARVLIVGTGGIALQSLDAVACVKDFSRIQVYSRDHANRASFAATAKSRMSLAVEAVDELQPAVEAADVVVVATNAGNPVLEADWVREGTHICTAGIRCELPEDLYLRAGLVVVGSKEHEQGYIDDLYAATDNTLVRLATTGAIRWGDIAELGEVVGGSVAPSASTTIFRESQGGFGDVALANLVYERARARGVGRHWDINR